MSKLRNKVLLRGSLYRIEKCLLIMTNQIEERSKSRLECNSKVIKFEHASQDQFTAIDASGEWDCPAWVQAGQSGAADSAGQNLSDSVILRLNRRKNGFFCDFIRKLNGNDA